MLHAGGGRERWGSLEATGWRLPSAAQPVNPLVWLHASVHMFVDYVPVLLVYLFVSATVVLRSNVWLLGLLVECLRLVLTMWPCPYVQPSGAWEELLCAVQVGCWVFIAPS